MVRHALRKEENDMRESDERGLKVHEERKTDCARGNLPEKKD